MFYKYLISILGDSMQMPHMIRFNPHKLEHMGIFAYLYLPYFTHLRIHLNGIPIMKEMTYQNFMQVYVMFVKTINLDL